MRLRASGVVTAAMLASCAAVTLTTSSTAAANHAAQTSSTRAATVASSNPAVAAVPTDRRPERRGRRALTEHVMTSDLGTMEYSLYIPRSVRPRPSLVVHLHGGNEDRHLVMRQSRLNELARRKGFIAVYPQEDPNNSLAGIWDWAGAASDGRDGRGPSLIAAITRKVIRDHGVDRRHVYISGISAGGGMVVAMAATYPDLYKAFHVEVGCMFASSLCVPQIPQSDSTADVETSAARAYLAMGPRARRMPFLVSYGDADPLATAANQDTLIQQWLGTNDWADDREANGSIATKPGLITTGARNGRTYTIDHYSDADGCLLGQRWLIHGLFHAYSGGRPEGNLNITTDPLGPNMRAVAYRFFQRQTRTSSPC